MGASFIQLLIFGIAAVVVTTLAAEKKPRIAYVTNGVNPFWNVAVAGVRQAAQEFDVDTEVLMPVKGIVDQKSMVQALLVRGVDGIAISPIDAKSQVSLINEVAALLPSYQIHTLNQIANSPLRRFETLVHVRAAYPESFLTGLPPHFADRSRPTISKAVEEIDALLEEVFAALQVEQQKAAA